MWDKIKKLWKENIALFELIYQAKKYWFAIIVLVIGVALLILGMTQYYKVTYEPITKHEGLIILGDEDTKIKDMKIIISDDEINKEDWKATIIDLILSPRNTSLFITLPHEIKSVYFIKYGNYNFFFQNWSYYKTDDNSVLFFRYNSSNNENNIRILFNWKINEKISYDQEQVAIDFASPFWGKPIYQQRFSLAESSWLPAIDNLTIEIEGKHQLDLSLTQPPPSFYYYVNRKPTIYWIFDSKKEKSSVQAVFKNPNLSQEKSSEIFFSGLYIAIGISAIFLGIGTAIDQRRDDRRFK